jgi:prepilin-type N-terminal cleavage/methylation domain-containing protein
MNTYKNLRKSYTDEVENQNRGFTLISKACKRSSIYNYGFTLIELLIVIAILGVLAVVVLVAINPIEQLARTRDGGRLSSITQMGHALQAYYTTQNATYPAEASWNTALTTSGELSTLPSQVAHSANGTTDPGCNDNPQNSWCYDLDATNGPIIYTRLESSSNDGKCASPTTEIAWAVYSVADGRGGIVCTANAAGGLDPQASGGFTYR